MGPPKIKRDPRTIARAYIVCGPTLFYVLGTAGETRVSLENCKTLEVILDTEQHVVTECELVRSARKKGTKTP